MTVDILLTLWTNKLKSENDNGFRSMGTGKQTWAMPVKVFGFVFLYTNTQQPIKFYTNQRCGNNAILIPIE